MMVCIAAVLAACSTEAQPPAPPTSVVVSASAGSILVTWPGVVGADAFDVHRSSGDGAWVVLDSVAAEPGGTSYRDRDVEAGSTYRYGVSARRGALASAVRESDAVVPLPPINVAERRAAATDDEGIAVVQYESYGVEVQVSAATSGDPVGDIAVSTIAMTDGILVLASPGDGDYRPAIDFIRYDAFAPVDGQELKPQFAVVSTIFLVVAIGAAAVAVYELVTDPPYYEEIVNDDGLVQDCLVGDINDVLAVMDLVTLGTAGAGYLRVIGAPARVRGVTAIQMGFTRAHVADVVAKHALLETLDSLTGVLSEKRKICQLSVGNRITSATTWLPYVVIEVDEEEYTAPVDDPARFSASVGTVEYGASQAGTVFSYTFSDPAVANPADLSVLFIGPEGWNGDSVFLFERTQWQGSLYWVAFPALTSVSGRYSTIVTGPDGTQYVDEVMVDADRRHPAARPITVTEASVTEVSASWPGVAGTAYYKVDIMSPTDSGFFPTAAKHTTATSTTFSGLDLDPMLEYRFRVWAVTATDVGDLDDQVDMSVAVTSFTPGAALVRTTVDPRAIQAGDGSR